MKIEFEWDEEKRLINLDRHAVDVMDAITVFDGRPVITVPDPRHVERRYKSVAELGPHFITVV